MTRSKKPTRPAQTKTAPSGVAQPRFAATSRTLGAGTAAAAISVPRAKPKAGSRAGPPPARPDPAEAPSAPGPETPPADSAPGLRKQELIEKVVTRSGIRKRDAKPVVEAMLAVLGDALAEGRELDLQPMGKVMQTRRKDKPNARILAARIRQSKKAAPAREDAVAPPDE